MSAMPDGRIFGYARDTTPLFILPGQEGSVDLPKLESPESKLVGFAEALYQAGIQFRDNNLGMLDRFRSNMSWYLHASNPNIAYGHRSDTVINMIFEKVESIAAAKTASDPSAQFLPQERADIEFSDMMNDAFQYIWHRQAMTSEMIRLERGTAICGTWYSKIVHDPRYGNDTVEKHVAVPPWNIVPAPYHLDPESAPWMIEMRYRTVGEIWNDYGVAVSPEVGTKEVDVRVHELLRQYPYLGTISTVDAQGASTGEIVPGIPDTFLTNYNRTGLVLQKELHLRDGATTPKYWWDRANGLSRPPQLRYSRQLKNPGGRVISWANGQLLYDTDGQPYPYKDGEFPYVKWTDTQIPDFWYGMGEVEPLINLQLMSDDVFAIMKQILAFTASGRLVVDESTGLGEGDIGNEPGEIWFVDEGTADGIRWHEGSQIPQQMFQLLHFLQQGSDLMSGQHDVTRGINPQGVTAGKALIALQRSANVRVNSRIRESMRPMTRMARLFASRVQQFWPSSKTIRVLGRENVTQDQLLPIEFRDYTMSDQERNAAFDIRVVPGVNIDELKDAEFERAMALYQMGLMSNEMLIDHANMSQKERLQAELPALLAMREAAKAGPPGPTPEQPQQEAA